MSLSSSLTIAQMNPDGSVPVPESPDAAAHAAVEALRREEAVEALTERMQALQEVLDKPLSEILAERDRFKETAAAWDAFAAMWVLSQRAMRHVAMELAAAQGVAEETVVARALARANQVLNTEDEDLGGSIAPAQMAHIARHRPFLRKQFRPG
ncbi:hypothetical protein M4R22_11835 [Acidovorax sp. GBBC 3334]|uniref:hypothetical protein n=1 Tax=unclassified Acidovorax TaxID=2684926 RepID=UPI0023047D88|nr:MULTISPECIES: hypothetical protein [unclassified Acidovorax]MDA8455453.1 hypothetical protein [Acidovorax sp. GBBC 3334]MDA8522568.1 hypothetical protein [Acidovorax sp. NCPPB 4044]